MSRVPNSIAVMASRSSPLDALDMFPTPPWATRALIHLMLGRSMFDHAMPFLSVWEPACGKGHMAIPLKEAFGQVFSSDVNDWGYGDQRNLDFGFAVAADNPNTCTDWVITNPPFKAAELFLDRGLQVARCGVALLLRLQFLEGQDRFVRIFGGDRRPAIVAPFAERVAMIEGVWDPEASSATAYAWFIWTAEPVTETVIAPIPPGAARRHSILADMSLATPGEARRRRLARQAQ